MFQPTCAKCNILMEKWTNVPPDGPAVSAWSCPKCEAVIRRVDEKDHESTRALFETWLRSRHITALDRHNMPLGTYQSDPVQCMWEGWCAALEHAKGDWDGEAFKRGVLAGTSSVTEDGVRKEIKDLIVERDTCKSEWEKAVGVAGMLRTELDRVKGDLKHVETKFVSAYKELQEAKQYGAHKDQTASTFMNQVKHLQTPAGALGVLGGWMKQDLDYAWTWHCNIAMAIHDCGGRPHSACNEGAARFLALLFPGVDTTKHPAYGGTQTQKPPIQKPSDDICHICGCAYNTIKFKHGDDVEQGCMCGPRSRKLAQTKEATAGNETLTPWSFETRPKHPVWVYRKGYISDRLIVVWKDDSVAIAGLDGLVSYDQLFHDWLCRDGSPCGHVATPAPLTEPKWSMPMAPPWRRWYRGEEFTQEMLPPGTRPMMEGERVEIGDEFFDGGPWKTHDRDSSGVGLVLVGAEKKQWYPHRTRRPLPEPAPMPD